MAYRFVSFPITFNDFRGHSFVAELVKYNSRNSYTTFSTVLTDTVRRTVPR